MVANPTLLQPGTWAWKVHYASCPFSNYYPLEPAEYRSGSSEHLLQVGHVLQMMNLIICTLQRCLHHKV